MAGFHKFVRTPHIRGSRFQHGDHDMEAVPWEELRGKRLVRSLVVAEAGEQKLDLVQDFIDMVTSMCARIYGRRAASNRAKKALAAAQEEP